MAEKLDCKEVVSFEEALKMERLIKQALIDVLAAKGIRTYDEVEAKGTELRLPVNITSAG